MESPLLIISPARSGSKLLRSILYNSGDFSCCFYDANYVWKYGNYHIPHDELEINDVSNNNLRKIYDFFEGICHRQGSSRLLEKTVSNSLRISFVREIFPDAKFILLHREPSPTISSTMLCWEDGPTSERIQTAEDRRRKIKEFPFSMAWPYLLQYLRQYMSKKLFDQKYVSSWGPRYKGIDSDVINLELSDVCARQWSRCIEMSVQALSGLTLGQDYLDLSYEDLIRDPETKILRISEFAGIQGKENALKYAETVIDPDKAKSTRYQRLEFSESTALEIDRAKSALNQLLGHKKEANGDAQ